MIKILLRFANGSDLWYETAFPYLPRVCRYHDDQSGATFYFYWVDQLPSGMHVFKETTKEEAAAMLSGS